MSIADTDPEYYSEENHGYWLLAPDYNLMARMPEICRIACESGIACWLPEYDPHSDVPPF